MKWIAPVASIDLHVGGQSLTDYDRTTSLKDSSRFACPYASDDSCYSENGAAMISFSTVSFHAPGACSRQRPSNQVPSCAVGLRLQ